MSADLIARLIEAGTPAELVAEVAMKLARAEAASEVLEQRRAKDRERKKAPRNSEESAEVRGTVGSPSPEVFPHTPFPNPNPIPPAPKGASPQKIMAAWNEMAERTGLPAVKSLTSDRLRRLKARIGDHGESGLLDAIQAVGKSKFCRGENDRGWRADFDFLLQPKSCVRLIEGSYGNNRNERLTV